MRISVWGTPDKERLSSLVAFLTLFWLAPIALAEDPERDLYGEWEIVAMIHRTNVQNLGGQGGSFVFEPGEFIYALDREMRDKVMQDKVLKKVLARRCVVRPREMDVTTKPLLGRQEKTLKALYELKNGTLRVIWPDDYGERPASFDDAVKHPNLTLFVLKRRDSVN